MITRFLLERALDMLPVASDDDTRYHISGVYILSDNGTVVLTATDGYRLMERTYENVKCPNGHFMIFRDDASALKILLKQMKYADEIDASIDLNGALFVGSDTSAKARISKYDSQYPNYKGTIPSYPETQSICLNTEFLLGLAKALTDGERRAKPTVRITFNANEPNTCLLIEALGEREGKTRTVLMPIRPEAYKKKGSAA